MEAAEPAMEPGCGGPFVAPMTEPAPGAEIMEGGPMVESAPGAEKILVTRAGWPGAAAVRASSGDCEACGCNGRGAWKARKKSSDLCGNPEIGGRTFPAITGIAARFAPPLPR